MNNNKKEFPICGDEQDVCYGRKLYKYLNSSVPKKIKRKMNKRFRRNHKPSLIKAQEELHCMYDEY